MLNIILNNNLEKPLYKQIMIEIKESIISGEVKEQEQLPSIRILAKQLKISVITVKRAYEELKKVGLIYGIEGKGFYVADNNIDILREKRKSIIKETLQKTWQEARKLGMKKEDIIDMLKEI